MASMAIGGGAQHSMVRSSSGSFKLERRPDPKSTSTRVAQHTRFHSFAGFEYEQPSTKREDVKAPPRLTHRPQDWEHISAPMPAVTSMGHPPPMTRRADQASEYKLYKNFKADCLKGSRMKFGPAQKFEKPVLSSHEYGWVKPAVQKTPRERGEDPNFHPLNSSAITKTADLQLLGPRRNGLEVIMSQPEGSRPPRPK